MKLRSRTTVLGLLAAGLIAFVTALTLAVTTGAAGTADLGPVPPVRPDSAARTSFPGLAAPAGEPELASMRAARPVNGQVLQVRGPFDERFVLEDLTFDGSAVSGAMLITSDVSDVLELQVLAGFHDQHGILLGTGRFVHHLGDEGHPHAGMPQERTKFKIAVPATLTHRAVSVTIGVPVLVNE